MASAGRRQSERLALPTGRWVDFLQHTKFSTDLALGFVELWVDAQPITLANRQTRYPCQTMLATHTGGAQFFLNNYHAAGMAGFADETSYFDEANARSLP